MFNQYNCSNEEEENNNEEEIKSLKCTFDLDGFHSMSQPMYRCRKCKVDIYVNHVLFYATKIIHSTLKVSNQKLHIIALKGLTSRKDAVCSYAFYGKEYVYQERCKCKTCRNTSHEGVFIVCAKKCHHNHDISYNEFNNHFCDYGVNKKWHSLQVIDISTF